MSNFLKLSILSPERRLLQSVDVQELTLTTSEGQIQILPGHGAMIGTLETGPFHYVTTGGDAGLGFISTGFFEVAEDHVTVLAETLEMKSEINLDRALKAQKAAEDALREASLAEDHFRKYQLKLQRSLVRQQIASKEHSGVV